KQRLALGCALLHEPSILFLDEPTSGVDPLTRRRFWDLIYELSEQGVTVFVTTHYMEEAEHCDRLGLIHRGALIARGAPAELKGEHLRVEVLEVLCRDPQGVMRALQQLPGIHDVSLFGSGLHATADDPEAGTRRILELLHDRGDSTARAFRIEPSLEDVFVALIEARDREAGSQAEVTR
ncbi:MAG TPA: ABC transporter ATP-binding protein, partial [Myxococcota bacterium]|nr:ABC transporter ATP-binding protein [Myxococcota bacterium]